MSSVGAGFDTDQLDFSDSISAAVLLLNFWVVCSRLRFAISVRLYQTSYGAPRATERTKHFS